MAQARRWFILAYHGIAWHVDPHTGPLQLEFAPDLFLEHVRALRRHARFLSVDDALAEMSSGRGTGDVFSIWFDDGYRGVREHALPLLRELGVTAAQAYCSDALIRRRPLWRLQLAYVASGPGREALVDRLLPLGFDRGRRLRTWTMDAFDDDVLAAVEAVYDEVATPLTRRMSERLLEDADGLRELAAAGWITSNHSARHLPIGEPSAVHRLAAEFEAAEAELHRITGEPTRFWVLPFDRPGRRAEGLIPEFRKAAGERHVVMVGGCPTTEADVDERVLFRYMPPRCSGADLLRRLEVGS